MTNLRKLNGFLRMAGPSICGLLASAGVVATAMLSAKGALKAKGILYNECLSKKEKIKAAAPYFAPSSVSGLATISFIVAGNILGSRQQAALVAGVAAAYKRCQKFYDETQNVEDFPDGPITFYDPVSDRYFNRTMEEVLEAEYHLNRNFILRGYAPLNELYDFLSLEKTPDGEKLGWSQEVGGMFYGYEWIDFHHWAVAKGGKYDRDCYVIHMPFAPTDDYLSDPYDE